MKRFDVLVSRLGVQSPLRDGTLNHAQREELWAKFSTAAPRRLRRSVGQSKLVKESVRGASKRYGVSPTTVQKWRSRQVSTDGRMDPKEARSSVLSLEQEAVIVAFRRHALLPLDDCLHALQPTIPHLTRSSLHRCLQRHGVSRLPDVDGDKSKRSRFKAYPIG